MSATFYQKFFERKKNGHNQHKTKRNQNINSFANELFRKWFGKNNFLYVWRWFKFQKKIIEICDLMEMEHKWNPGVLLTNWSFHNGNGILLYTVHSGVSVKRNSIGYQQVSLPLHHIVLTHFLRSHFCVVRYICTQIHNFSPL